MNNETLEDLKKQLSDARIEQQMLLHTDDLERMKQNQEKLKSIKTKISQLKYERIANEELYEKLIQELEDAHFDEFAHRNDTKASMEIKERIKHIRKEIARVKIEINNYEKR